ncbi:methyltransferase domain-containing protein [Pseudoduganella namucuonensis]|uniref:Thiopurine S-methyltransferase (TPMT) n=1 Tax=Pseudoduganella namucuonensis TaxID=1035707 RepID=A0A1I7KCK8_9BURK|nr:methyltransferase domain-containing protein [Pseudoduganella namucuonensis]SFU95181.1 Thiopurine S-methyltransferase (TPMT) [Pseudoduganella namucuonensis]
MNFQSRDPLSPAFWDERFEQRFTPWDRGGVPERLRSFVADSSFPDEPPAVLIPGCGSAWELAHFSESGWSATAIDFSPSAVAAARAAVGPRWQERVVEADFFAWQPSTPLRLIYERAFLCALPREMWPRVAARWAELLAPGALLAGYFFFDDNEKGPPFGIARERLDALLQASFILVEDEPVTDSIPVFEGKERWMVWRRT